MKSKLTKFAQAASFGLALVFTFGCSDNKDEGETHLGENELVSSSSSMVALDCSGFIDGSKVSFYGNSHPQFCDPRDGKIYVYANIGTQTWMAENLNYKASGSICFYNDDKNCDVCGRLYDWATAMNSCPSGWHLPTTAEWSTLVNFIGGPSIAGTKLKTKNDNFWVESGYGTNDYGFSALPCGFFSSEIEFNRNGLSSYWWTASYDEIGAYGYSVHYNDSLINENEENYYDKSAFFSIRCIK